jgi:prepilin-type N-terminal cleavage/methylation domain-containing protein
MESASTGRPIYWHDGKSANRPEGFSLPEMMTVVTVILIVASISAPIYMTATVRAREAVLRGDLSKAVSSQPSAFSERAES